MRAGRSVGVVLAVLVALGVGRAVVTAPIRAIDTDELEHLHVAWAISQGQVPYRDFFEHHTPLYHLALALLCSEMRPAEDPDAAVACVLSARWLSLVACLALVAAVSVLGWRVRGGVGAAVTAVFALGSEVLVAKGLEIRPDAGAVALVATAVVCLGCVADSNSGRRRLTLLFLAGTAVGLAVMMTQKVVFLLPGVGAATWVAWRRARRLGRPLTFAQPAALAVGAALPCLATLVWLWKRGAASRFLELTLLENLQGTFKQPLGDSLWVLLAADPFLVVVGGVGLICACFRCLRAAHGELRDVLAATACLAVSGVCGVAVMPVPYPQALLLFVPFLAVLAGVLLIDLLDRLAVSRGRDRAAAGLALAALAGGAWLVVAVGPPVDAPDWAAPVLDSVLVGPSGLAAWTAVWLGVWLLARLRRPGMAVALAALTLQPALYGLSAGLLWPRNDEQLAMVRWIAAATPPDASVLDGWTGYGVFRPHSWYYFMLPAQVRAMVPDAAVADLARRLRDGTIAPDLIVVDEELMSLGPEVTGWLLERYRIRRGPFLARE